MRKIILVLAVITLILLPIKISYAGAPTAPPSPVVNFGVYKNESGFYATKKLTGTTDGDYPENANCRLRNAFLLKEKTVFLYNTGEEDLEFKIIGYPTDEAGVGSYALSNSEGEVQVDITVEDGNVGVVNLIDDKVQVLDIFVKSATPSESTEYSCIITGLLNR